MPNVILQCFEVMLFIRPLQRAGGVRLGCDDESNDSLEHLPHFKSCYHVLCYIFRWLARAGKQASTAAHEHVPPFGWQAGRNHYNPLVGFGASHLAGYVSSTVTNLYTFPMAVT